MNKDYKKELIKLVEKTEVNKGYHDYFKNKDLVNNYFEIGRLLVEAQGGEERAKYGNELIKEWSIELVRLFGKGYDYTNLCRFRQFYVSFKNIGALRQYLTWTNIRLLLPIKDINKRNYYINMCIKKNLSSRALEKEIKNNAFERLSLADKENIKLISNKKEVDRKAEVININGELKVGIAFLTTYEYETDPSITVKTKSSESGSSGGLMLSLAIYNAITKEDITKGKTIVGTGTIDVLGNVGKIDGVKYKILGAGKNKADLFICPKDNYDDAMKVKKEHNLNINIISVETFDEAINYLENNL